MIKLYTEEQVEAYWCVRAMIQWGGLLAAIGSMVVLAVLVVKGKWPWLALVEGMVFVCAVVLAAGWVPKRLRPKIIEDPYVTASLLNVHSIEHCAGEYCVIHNPSEHHMRVWPLNWRGDKGLMERICPHGIGHPDPDDIAFHIRNGREALGVHGCDGCCARGNG